MPVLGFESCGRMSVCRAVHMHVDAFAWDCVVCVDTLLHVVYVCMYVCICMGLCGIHL
jgi:hypothetical protein